MEESISPIQGAPTPTSTSLFSRLSNVFVSPGEVFDEVKSSPPQPANWIAPLVIAMIVGIIYTLVVFSQPAVIQQMQQAQEKKFQEMVDAKKMTQAQADKSVEAMQKFMNPAFMKIMGCAGSVVTSAGILFLVALVVWAVGLRALRGNFTYMKAVEVAGLATMIHVLGAIVAMLLAVIYGNMMITPGPVLLVSHFDPANVTHRILSALNVTSIWYVAVVSIGLAKLSGTTFAKAAVWLFGIWAVFTFLPILLLARK
jgi:hypothetical protein